MASLIDAFAYVVIDAYDVAAWTRFAEDALALEVVPDGGGVRLRMDERAFRYLVRPSPADKNPIIGWEVGGRAALDTVVERVGGLGLSVDPLDGTELAQRAAAGGVRFRCHNGIHHEVAYGLASGGPFKPSGDVSGYVTGAGGLGHSVWEVTDVAAMDALLLGALGMSLREEINTPGGTGHFYGCNPRHHSLAVVSGPTLKMVHLLAEMAELDDVGRAADRVVDRGYEILEPLGRHRTDHMVSFYIDTPGGFGMEVGWGGVLCGDDWPAIRDASRRRPWGHSSAMRKHQKTFEKAAASA